MPHQKNAIGTSKQHCSHIGMHLFGGKHFLPSMGDINKARIEEEEKWRMEVKNQLQVMKDESRKMMDNQMDLENWYKSRECYIESYVKMAMNGFSMFKHLIHFLISCNIIWTTYFFDLLWSILWKIWIIIIIWWKNIIVYPLKADINNGSTILVVIQFLLLLPVLVGLLWNSMHPSWRNWNFHIINLFFLLLAMSIKSKRRGVAEKLDISFPSVAQYNLKVWMSNFV